MTDISATMIAPDPLHLQASNIIDAIVAEFRQAANNVLAKSASTLQASANNAQPSANKVAVKALNRQALELHLSVNGWKVANMDACFMYLCKHGPNNAIIGFTACPVEGVESRYFDNFIDMLCIADKVDKTTLLTQFTA